MRIKWETSILNRYLLLHFQTMKVPKTPTRGISARVPHTSLFVLFLDYDNITDERLDDELPYLQELNHLGDLNIFKTNEFGRHVIGTDCLRPRDCMDVLEASSCDWSFKRGIRINEYRTWVLRGWEKGEREKPIFLRTLESPYNGEHLQSRGHAKFLEAFYGVPVRLVNPFGSEEIEIQGYKTNSKVTVKQLKEEMEKHGRKR
jgi:hypothetical protein